MTGMVGAMHRFCICLLYTSSARIEPSVYRPAAFTGMSAKSESLYTDPALEVSLSVSSNEAYTTWLAADMKEMEGGSGFQTIVGTAPFG